MWLRFSWSSSCLLSPAQLHFSLSFPWVTLCLLSLPPACSEPLGFHFPRDLTFGVTTVWCHCSLVLGQPVPLQAGIPEQSWQERFPRSAGKADCCHRKAADIPDPGDSLILRRVKGCKSISQTSSPRQDKATETFLPKSGGSSCLRLVLLESSPSSWNVGPVRAALGDDSFTTHLLTSLLHTGA